MPLPEKPAGTARPLPSASALYGSRRRMFRWLAGGIVGLMLLVGSSYVALRVWARHELRSFVRAASDDASSTGNPLVAAIRSYQRDNGRWPDPYDLERELVPKYAAKIDIRWFFCPDGSAPELSARCIWQGDDVFLRAKFDEAFWNLGKMKLDVPIPQ